jgi:hypothetical protein
MKAMMSHLRRYWLQHLYFWIQKNAANQKHLHDGYYWTYNSAQVFTVIFPFWFNDCFADGLVDA